MKLAKAKNVLCGILVPIFSPLARLPTPLHTAVRWPGMCQDLGMVLPGHEKRAACVHMFFYD